MRLNTISIENFRSVLSAELEFARVNWILGDNFSGKTSTLRAIESALLAQASSFVVNADAKSAKVSMSVTARGRDTDIELTRYRSKVTTPKVNGAGMPRTEYAKAMPALLGVSERVLDAVLSSGQFMAMDADKQASLILDACGVSIDWDAAESAFADWCGEQDITYFEISEEIDPIRLSGIALIEAIYSDAYARRRAANREVSAETKDEPVPPADILQYVGNARMLTDLREEARTLSARIPVLRQKIAWVDEIERVGDPKKELDSIDQAGLRRDAAELKRRRQLREEAVAVVSEARASRDAQKSVVDSLASSKCPFGVKCNFSEWAPSEWSELNDKLAKAEADLQSALAALDEVKPVLSADISRLQAERTRIDALERKIEVRAQLLEKIGGDDKAAMALELDQVEGRMRVVRGLIDSVAAHERAMARFGEASERQEKVAIRANRLDTIVKAFEKAIRFSLVDEVLHRFVGPMEAALKLFVGDNFTFSASADGGFRIEVIKKGLALPFEELSESEKLMVSAAAQHAIATIAGAGILVIDALDTLRGDVLQRFIRGIYTIAKGYETVVVASTIGRISPETSPLRNRERFPDTRLFVVRDGTLAALPQLSRDEMRALL